MKQMLINSMVSFTLGTGASLIGLYSWLGTTDLQTIRTSVQNYMVEVEEHSMALASDYEVSVNSANAEIGEYQEALDKANGNINKLISAYQQAEEQHQKELSDLQVELGKMQTRLDSQYEQDMNAIIEQANREINNANIEVAETKEQVISDLQTSQVDEIVQSTESLQINTGGDKSVVEITDIVGE